ncbi:MAG TPA: cysteine rich repeat-containing protein [Gallionella sp.]|nr:cysteine rich repeat-containing protein [Gallionella sp.]
MNHMTAQSGAPMKWLAVLAGVFCLAIATGASAAQASKPCADDAAKLCPGVQPGGGAIAKCLKEHASELSPACKQNIAKAKKKAKELKEACRDDAKALCKGMKPGGGKILQCLKQHEDELSPSCKAEMDKPRGKNKM